MGMKTRLIMKRIKEISAEYKFGDFFRNFIAVLLGILITFVGNDWIEARSTRNEIKKTLQLIESELLLNRDGIRNMGETVALNQRAANYIFENKNKVKSIPCDSVRKYLSPLFQWDVYTLTDDAMEMFKASGLIQKVQDKELVLNIIKAYGTVKVAETYYGVYADHKNQALEKFQENADVKAATYRQIRRQEKTSDFGGFMDEHLRLLAGEPEGLEFLITIANTQSSQNYMYYIGEIDRTIEIIRKYR